MSLVDEIVTGKGPVAKRLREVAERVRERVREVRDRLRSGLGR